MSSSTRIKSLAKSTALMLMLLSSHVSASASPTAIKKLSPDANEKIFPEHLAFAPIPVFSPNQAAAAAISFLDQQDEELLRQTNVTMRRYRPAFGLHFQESEANVLRRAAEALSLLERRQACPSGMNNCSKVGSPNKCCQEGTYCSDVTENKLGQVACCPYGATCGGGVGNCPTEARSCSAELGGGCCIPGYVCQGVGCIPEASATPETSTSTATETQSAAPSTTASGSQGATGGAPWRPTSTDDTITASATQTETSTNDETQTGCPTGFYGCLAQHGGGCCQTDRECNTHSCPAPSSTTIISDGATIVVAVTDVPTNAATATCADGWSLCGAEGGPVSGCCPSGFECGTASCFTSQASQTVMVQKKLPDSAPARAGFSFRAAGAIAGGWLLAAIV